MNNKDIKDNSSKWFTRALCRDLYTDLSHVLGKNNEGLTYLLPTQPYNKAQQNAKNSIKAA